MNKNDNTFNLKLETLDQQSPTSKRISVLAGTGQHVELISLAIHLLVLKDSRGLSE